MGRGLRFLIMYLAIPPFVLWFGKMMKDQFKYSLYGRKRSQTAIAQEAEAGFNARLKERKDFTKRDPRTKPIPYKIIYIAIYALGAIGSFIVGTFDFKFKYAALMWLFNFGSMAFSYITADEIVVERKKVLERMLSLKQSKMGLVSESKSNPILPDEIEVLEWHDDLITPKRLYLYMPTTFDSLQVTSFLESFNLIFNSHGQWIANMEDENYTGFDFNAGVASLRVSPPLPQRADWHERYLLNEKVHWSFFPLAIGSENGIPIENEETGKVEHVLGFAVNSGQNKLSAKQGVTIGSEIVAAPQILIAGGTGGGKSLSVDTLVVTVTDD